MSLSQTLKKLFIVQDVAVTDAPPVSSNELVHINQEMYKKSAELAEKNKTLSLLQNINEFLLSSITNPQEIAKQVMQLLLSENDFLLATLMLYDKRTKRLSNLAGSQSLPLIDFTHPLQIPMTDSTNIVVQSINNRQTMFAKSLAEVFPTTGDILKVKSVFVSPLFVRNEIIGAIIIAMSEEQEDISEHRIDLLNRVVGSLRIGIDNALLYNQVEDSNRRLKELDKLKNEFVSVASHELRTPMTAIKSYLWMALNGKGGPLTEKQKYYIERGYNSVDRLIRLVNDMLNISRIESGRITIEMKSLDVVVLTQEVVDEVMPRANEVGVSVVIQKPASLPKVFADSDKIKEVLFNLIGNSLKFTPKGGSITISYLQQDGFVETRIVDTGAGLEPEDIGKLFQKFGLLPGSYITNQTSMGTGLGLYICRAIIDLHHGEIQAASEGRGKGATFTFTLKEYNESEAQHVMKENISEEKDKMELIHVQV